MADIATQLTEDLKSAMRAKDSTALSTLRAVKSAIKNAAIEKGGADAELDEGETVNIIRKQIKQRQESIEQFNKAGRGELASKEEAEIAILDRYLPALELCGGTRSRWTRWRGREESVPATTDDHERDGLAARSGGDISRVTCTYEHNKRPRTQRMLRGR